MSGGFAKVSYEMLDRWTGAEIGAEARVLALLLRNGLRKGLPRKCELSARSFEDIGLSPRTGKQALRRLVDAGLVECVEEPRGRRAGRYLLKVWAQETAHNPEIKAQETAHKIRNILRATGSLRAESCARTIQEEYSQEIPPRESGGAALSDLLIRPSKKDLSACRTYEAIEAPFEVKARILEIAIGRVRAEAQNGKVGRINALALCRATDSLNAELAESAPDSEHYFN